MEVMMHQLAVAKRQPRLRSSVIDLVTSHTLQMENTKATITLTPTT